MFRFQGRYGKGKGQEYLEKFMVEYRRGGGDNVEWRIYADRKGKQVNNMHLYCGFRPKPL